MSRGEGRRGRCPRSMCTPSLACRQQAPLPTTHLPTHLGRVLGVVQGAAGALLGVAGILTAVLQAGQGRRAEWANRLGSQWQARSRRGRQQQGRGSTGGCNCITGQGASESRWAEEALFGRHGKAQMGSITHLGTASHCLLHIGSGRLDRVLDLAGGIAAAGWQAGEGGTMG